jgi:hypothetical protein
MEVNVWSRFGSFVFARERIFCTELGREPRRVVPLGGTQRLCLPDKWNRQAILSKVRLSFWAGGS